jgi:uncharacterized protein YlaI
MYFRCLTKTAIERNRLNPSCSLRPVILVDAMLNFLRRKGMRFLKLNMSDGSRRYEELGRILSIDKIRNNLRDFVVKDMTADYPFNDDRAALKEWEAILDDLCLKHGAPYTAPPPAKKSIISTTKPVVVPTAPAKSPFDMAETIIHTSPPLMMASSLGSRRDSSTPPRIIEHFMPQQQLRHHPPKSYLTHQECHKDVTLVTSPRIEHFMSQQVKHHPPKSYLTHQECHEDVTLIPSPRIIEHFMPQQPLRHHPPRSYHLNHQDRHEDVTLFSSPRIIEHFMPQQQLRHHPPRSYLTHPECHEDVTLFTSPRIEHVMPQQHVRHHSPRSYLTHQECHEDVNKSLSRNIMAHSAVNRDVFGFNNHNHSISSGIVFKNKKEADDAVVALSAVAHSAVNREVGVGFNNHRHNIISSGLVFKNQREADAAVSAVMAVRRTDALAKQIHEQQDNTIVQAHPAVNNSWLARRLPVYPRPWE